MLGDANAYNIHPTAGVSNVLSRFSFCVLLKNLPDAGESHRQPLFSECTNVRRRWQGSAGPVSQHFIWVFPRTCTARS